MSDVRCQESFVRFLNFLLMSLSLNMFETLCTSTFIDKKHKLRPTDSIDTQFPSILFSIDSKKSVAHYKTV